MATKLDEPTLINDLIRDRPTLCANDAPAITSLAGVLQASNQSEDAIRIAAGDMDYDRRQALCCAAEALKEYRAWVMSREGKVFAENLPVRKAAPAGDGGGRYYWRARTENGCLVPCIRHPDKNRGTYADAKRFACDKFCKGERVMELIPPDIDPQQAEWEDRQKNTAERQAAGMTVRQRTKKH